MADMHSELNRRLNHPQPARVPDTHWSADGDYLHPGTDPAACGSCKAHDPATGVNAGPPSDRDGAGDAPDEAKGVSTPAPVAVNEGDAGPCPAVVRCPDRIYCPPSCQQAGSREDPAHRPLTPADPHPHAWADLGTPGLHGVRLPPVRRDADRLGDDDDGTHRREGRAARG